MTTLEYETLLVEDTLPGVRRLTLNRPQVLNAISDRLAAELATALEAAEADPGVRAVVLTGAGRAFCAGVDLKEAAAHDPPADPTLWWYDHTSAFVRASLAVWDMATPVVAAVNGHAMGAGCDLAMVCDITLASDRAVFGEPEVRHISAPPTLIMPWLVGPKRAKELLLTGDAVDARTACAYGIANRVVAHEQLLPEAERLAERIAQVPPFTVRLNKQAINFAFETMGLRSALRHNAALTSLVHLSAPAEQAQERRRIIREEGLRAFLERRDGAFGER